MFTKKKVFTIVVTMAFALMLGLSVANPTSLAFAQTPGTPVSGDGVVPLEYDGNVSCQYLGYAFGFKIEGNGSDVYTGELPFIERTDLTPSRNLTHTGGAPNDPSNYVTLNSNGYYLNWASTLGIDAVIVKGGQDSNAYVYVPEDKADTGLSSPDLDSGARPLISHVEFCYDYELTATKTANTSYTRTYDWKITKEADGDYKRFIGDPAIAHPYTVSVDRIETDSAFAVAGEIVVTNPSPLTVSFSVSDSVGGTAATVSCPASVAPYSSATCTYTASLGGKVDGTNTATITSSTYGVKGTTATAGYTFGEPTTKFGHETVNVTDTNGGSWTASSDASWPYTKDFTCPTDKSLYVGGVYTAPAHVNTAEITETGQEDTATVNLTCYAPVVSKDATAEWQKKYDWSISKIATPDSLSGFIGDTLKFNYDVVVDQTVTDSYKAYGTITVTNPNPAAVMNVTLADAVDGVAATLDCGGALAVPAGGTSTCGYTVDLLSNTDTINTATATFNKIDFAATTAVDFGDAIIVGDPTINVTDTLGGVLGSASVDKVFKYSHDFTCSTKPGDYKDGVDVDIYPNTATITETGQAASEDVTVTCYAPVVSKTANTEWRKKYDWSITKTADPKVQSGVVGDTFQSAYDVIVDQTVTDYGFKASGVISVKNPNPNAEMVVTLADVVGLKAATLDCGGTLTVPAGVIGTCGYTVDLPNANSLVNTATVSFKGIAFPATAKLVFGAPIIEGYPKINVTDSVQDYLGSADSDFTFKYDRAFTCSTNPADYVDGVDVDKYPNTATIKETGQNDSEEVTVTCYAPVVSKDVSTKWFRSFDWTIKKTANPATHNGFAGDEFTTNYDVVVDLTTKDYGFAAYGVISVYNPAGQQMEVNVSDAIEGIAANVDCDPAVEDYQTQLVVAAGQTGTCTYNVGLPDKDDTQNTATATFKGAAFTFQAPVSFGPYTAVGNETITVSDSVKGFVGSASDDYTFEYANKFTCSSNPGDYTGFYDTDTYPNTATITETKQSDDASVTVDCYIPQISKTATATYDERHEWKVVKTASPDQKTFAGNKVGYDWTVVVTEETFEEHFGVSGIITVTNRNPEDAMTVALSDVLSDGTPATISACTGDADLTDGLTIAADGSSVCDYTASPSGRAAGKNFATAALNNIPYTAEAGLNWTPKVSGASATLDDDQNPAWPVTLTEGGTFPYADPDGYTCPTDPEAYAGDGIATVYTDTNTATISYEGQTKSSEASTKVTCYAPVVSKDAQTEWRKKYDWTITKTVVPANHSGFAGDSFKSYYDVIVDQTITNYGFLVSGTITVKNPAGSPGDMKVDVVDVVSDNIPATVDCDLATDGLQTEVTVEPGKEKTCAYTAKLPDNSSRINTVTGTFNDIDFASVANVVFGDPIIEGYPKINVTDSVQGLLGQVDGDFTFKYERTFACSINPGDYTDLKDSDTYPNIAKIVETEQSDDASVTVDCYMPKVTKTAAGTYDETHTWDIEKSVDPTSQFGFPGDVLDWTWTVTLSESFTESNFDVSGVISVKNPSPDKPMTVLVGDKLSDGTLAVVDCDPEMPGPQGSLIIAADQTGSCTYEALNLGYTDLDLAPKHNTAVVKLNEIKYTAGVDFDYVANVINGSATVDDDMGTAFPTLVEAGKGPWSWELPGSHTCETNKDAYFKDGTYTPITQTLKNTAAVTGDDGQTDSAWAETTWACNAGFVDLLKLTNGLQDPAMVWSFALTVGPDGFDLNAGNPFATDSTPPALMDFGGPALNPNKTYTVCELGVAGGWTSYWQVDIGGGPVGFVPYDPNEDDVPPEDLGNRCVDFGANTTIPITKGATIHFQVDNTYPGGDPRTPGYWKNWNTCTTGGQQYTAANNGGYEDGFWLLDDVLNGYGIGGGIVWDNILNDDFFYPITSCEVGVDILDKRLVGDPDIVGDGKKMASDPFVNLATHLLAAQLNFAAGACVPTENVYNDMTVKEVATAAETLLDKYDYNGGLHKDLAKKSTDGTLANTYAGILDDYNNGDYCGSTK